MSEQNQKETVVLAGPSSVCVWDGGRSYAAFHLAGDLDVEVGCHDANGVVVVRILEGEGLGRTGRKTYLPLTKSRARAIASALMGAASEL